MFGDQMGSCNWRRSRFLLWGGIVWFCCGLITVAPTPAQGVKPPSSKAQPKNATNESKGVVTGVVRQGKIITVKWQESKVSEASPAKELDLQYSPNTRVLVKAPGRGEMIVPGRSIGAELTEHEGQLSGMDFVLFLDSRQKPSVTPDSELPNHFLAVGFVEEVYESRLIVNFGESGIKEVYVEPASHLSVLAVNPLFLKPGAKGTVEYLPSKEAGKPGMLVGIEVSRTDPFSEEELKGTNVTKTKSGVTSKTTPSKGASTTKRRGKPVVSNGGASREKPPIKDPFGVLDK